MSGRSFYPRKRHLALVLAAVSGILGVAACGDDPTTSVPPPPVTTSTPVLAPPPPALVAQVCLDRSRSYPADDFDGAKNLIADAIQARAGSAQGGATIYITLVGLNSFKPDATLAPIVLPPVLPQPSPTVSPTPTNPYARNQAAPAAATAAAQKASQDAAFAAALKDAQAKVQPSLAVLRGLHPAPESGTDLIGCVSRAADRFKSAPPSTHRVLIFASDMISAGIQQSTAKRSLDGATVKVIYFVASDAQQSDHYQRDWNAEFQRDHAGNAGSVPFLEPAESQTLSPATLFS